MGIIIAILPIGPEVSATELIERIDVNSNVMLGKPVIRGTRIPVELILRKLSEGATVDDLLDGSPHLTPEDIRAAIVVCLYAQLCTSNCAATAS